MELGYNKYLQLQEKKVSLVIFWNAEAAELGKGNHLHFSDQVPFPVLRKKKKKTSQGIEREGRTIVDVGIARRTLGKGGFRFSPHHLSFLYSLHSVCILFKNIYVFSS